MGKLQAFEILFSNNIDRFKPGDVMNGEVRIVLSAEKGDIRGIKVVCKGKAETHWTESRGGRRNKRTVHYTWKIPFFKHDLILRGAGKNNQVSSRMKLPMGDHHFPFQFQIPTQSLPPPFEGTVGFVRYYIKATIDRPWKFDHKVTRYFSVWTVKDLNLFPDILSVPTAAVENTVCCLCCESEPISLRVSLDKRGYVPGEAILITVELNNRCGRDLVSLVACLHQQVLYRAKNRSTVHIRHSGSKLAELRFEGSSAEGLVTYHRKPMVIPAVPPNNFEHCPNIDVTYSVKVKADVSGTPIDVAVAIPIIIGTVPAMGQPVPPSLHPSQPGPPPLQHPGFAPPYGQGAPAIQAQQHAAYAPGNTLQYQGYTPEYMQQNQGYAQGQQPPQVQGHPPTPGAMAGQYPPHWSPPPQGAPPPQGIGFSGFQPPITSQPQSQQQFSYSHPEPHQHHSQPTGGVHQQDIELTEYRPTYGK